jgi:hypothetical protein
MAMSERIVFQPYTLGARGGLKPGPAIACRTAAQAELRAEKAMEAGTIAGAHVVRVMADEEAGDYGEPEYLASYGQVPQQD